MLVLVVDSSTPAVTAALAEVTADGVALRAYRCTVDARAHGELLAPQVGAVLADVDARPADLGAIVAGLGPGPFTGLRVGLVTAAAMGQVLGIPTYGVCSLDGIGLPGPAPTGTATAGTTAAGEQRVLVAADARRKEVYWAVYDGGGRRIVGPEVDAPAVAAARARELAVTEAVGDGAHRYADVLGLPLRAEPRYPDAATLVTLAAARVRAGAPGETLTPLYLRRPDAVAATSRKSVLP
ncbi:tRNA (adenosine(37)-N6)-threonylcarbamoyltransferase complex dimerization subunit type 1 TsaB [Micromonospora sp. HUAS LYJ1]|uniref:tRNA (adenosine(37)-N6)-threonylcarbamoyltransferase complex dimerization subunit type 1 TsaB n=1 Tax=Micromonospora sp. HUAS LYJ1 TaxID=3061626 RepID=UPI00267225FA|nr:tRNA (adenosine(37)-N6)-threonylcarbamoyltransferase complex dimerization subunit type 1 TsaB [Micromonospora sp. HUAS LYJ1]WKU02429.1 tRNA (adenosine(37)-N6)-threonylcarbamoyltransferase complex dimerization subunit type 1 TsaB [Micromonospora sp. HUAS LYJ1]